MSSAGAAGAKQTTIAEYQRTYGLCLIRLSRSEEAEAELQKGHQVSVESLGTSHTQTQRTVKTIVELYESWGKPDKAAEYRAMLPASHDNPDKH